MDRIQPIKCFLIRGFFVNNTALRRNRQAPANEPICLGLLSSFHALFLSSSSLQGATNSLPQHRRLPATVIIHCCFRGPYGGYSSYASLHDLPITHLSVYLQSTKLLGSLDILYHGALRFILNCNVSDHQCDVYNRVGWTSSLIAHVHHGDIYLTFTSGRHIFLSICSPAIRL